MAENNVETRSLCLNVGSHGAAELSVTSEVESTSIVSTGVLEDYLHQRSTSLFLVACACYTDSQSTSTDDLAA
jgi:hypothetical protein